MTIKGIIGKKLGMSTIYDDDGKPTDEKVEEAQEEEQGQDVIIQWEDEEKYNPK